MLAKARQILISELARAEKTDEDESAPHAGLILFLLRRTVEGGEGIRADRLSRLMRLSDGLDLPAPFLGALPQRLRQGIPGGGRLHHLLPDLGGTGEADLRDARVGDQRRGGRGTRAGQHAQRPLGEARLHEEVRDGECGERRL